MNTRTNKGSTPKKIMRPTCTLGCLNQRPNPAKYHDKPWFCLHESTSASQPNAHKDPLKNRSCTTAKLHYNMPKYQQLTKNPRGHNITYTHTEASQPAATSRNSSGKLTPTHPQRMQTT